MLSFNYLYKKIIYHIIIKNINELSKYLPSKINIDINYNKDNNKINYINNNIKEITNCLLVSKKFKQITYDIINSLNFFQYDTLKYFINNHKNNHNLINRHLHNNNHHQDYNFIINLNEINKIKQLNYIANCELNCYLSIVKIETNHHINKNVNFKIINSGGSSSGNGGNGNCTMCGNINIGGSNNGCGYTCSGIDFKNEQVNNTIYFKLNNNEFYQESFYHLSCSGTPQVEYDEITNYKQSLFNNNNDNNNNNNKLTINHQTTNSNNNKSNILKLYKN